MKRLGLISVFLLCSFWLGAQTQWRLALNKDGIKVWVPKNADSRVQVFRAQTVIEASNDDLLAMIRHAEKYPQWVAQVSDAKVVRKKSTNDFIVWYEIAMPTGFTDRDVVLENQVVKLKDGTMRINLVSRANNYPVKKHMVRIDNAHGYWLFIPLSDNKTKVIYEFSADMEMNLPLWMINKFLVNSPYKTLKNLRQWLEK